MPPSPTPTPDPGEAATPDPGEAARREQELREAEALIADLKKRGMLGDASISDASSEGGISGWLIRNKIVAEESQANTALIGVVIVALVLAGVIFTFWDNKRPGTPLTAQQVEQLKQEPPVAPPTATPAQPVSSSPTP